MESPSHAPGWATWTADDVRASIDVPTASDDKYTRGVVGFVTGSEAYPGAAVLGVEAAARTGVGMVRYVGPARSENLVLARRPEVVCGRGRVQAWVIGSGVPEDDSFQQGHMSLAIADEVPMVIDAGAIARLSPITVSESFGAASVVATPHAGELSAMFGRGGVVVTREQIAHDPEAWCVRAATEFGVAILLKGHETHVASPDGERYVAHAAPNWLATAGAGDVLAGILGALVATAYRPAASGPSLAELAASAAWLHGQAATVASNGGPITALDVARAVPRVVASLLDETNDQ